MMIRRLAWVWVFCLTSFVYAAKPELPTKTIPDGLGYNIHFTDPKPGEMEMMKASGATIIRMDFFWGGTEREKGVYDFSAFDRLTDALEKHKVRPIYILDYSNRHYDEGLSPYSEEGRKAFAKWAAAAAVHFKGRGILWEMYNEPNISFWKPKPDPEAYIKLALETGKALREAAPDETYIGPATSEIDFDFLEKCFQAGLLEYWDAVSVHPYRQREPESVIPEYAKLRYMIDKYAPEGKKIPILSAEWGYSSAWANYNDELQGKMLPRQWMVNLACDVPVSIWYDWHDDGTDPKEPEHHFGTVNYEYKKDQTPVYEPKPSYLAAKTFTETFDGFKYNKRLSTARTISDEEFQEDVYTFVFRNGNDVRLAVWTTAKEERTVSIPCSPGKFKAVSYLGEKLPNLVANESGLGVTVSDRPIYLIPEQENIVLQKIADWESIPLCLCVSQSMKPYYLGPFTVKSSRSPVRQTASVALMSSWDLILQTCDVISMDPILMHYYLSSENEISFAFENPSKIAFSGMLQFCDYSKEKGKDKTLPLIFRDNETKAEISCPIQMNEKGEYVFGFSFDEIVSQKEELRIDMGDVRLRPLDRFFRYTPDTFEKSWRVSPDGDPKVASEQKLELGENGTAKLTYKFDAGWKFLNISPNTEELRKIEGKPKSLSVRIESDGSGNSVRMRFTDSQGQTFQPDGGKLTEKGPMFFTFDLQKEGTAHWGGPNDGVIHYPIRFDSIVIDGLSLPSGPNTLEISSPVLGYAGD